MAKDKKGFILYADQKELFTELTDQEAGQLIKHIFRYVNDENPEPESREVKISFIPIKQQLKRDLKHWESVREKRSLAGKASANKRQQNKHTLTNVERVEQNLTNQTVRGKVIVKDNVIVNDNVKVTVTDKDIIIKKEFEEFLELFSDVWLEDIAMKLSVSAKKLDELKEEFIKDRQLDKAYNEQTDAQLRSWFINFVKRNKGTPPKTESKEERNRRFAERLKKDNNL